MEDFFKFLAFTTLIVYVLGFWVSIVKESTFLTLKVTASFTTETSAFTNKAARCHNAEYHILTYRSSLKVTKFVLGYRGNDQGIGSRFPAAARIFFSPPKRLYQL
jgi:hypothetical protein